MAKEVVTSRLVVVDGAGRERLVATTSGPAVEVRVAISRSSAGGSTEVSLFAVDGRDDLPDGVGLQIWMDGSVVRELVVWEDQL